MFCLIILHARSTTVSMVNDFCIMSCVRTISNSFSGSYNIVFIHSHKSCSTALMICKFSFIFEPNGLLPSCLQTNLYSLLTFDTVIIVLSHNYTLLCTLFSATKSYAPPKLLSMKTISYVPRNHTFTFGSDIAVLNV